MALVGVADANFGNAGTVLNTKDSPLYIGNRLNNEAVGISGRIDNVRVYARVLSAAEVSAVYNYEKGSNSGTSGQAPVISVAPVAQAVVTGGTATFSVVATGTPAPAYQWLKGGVVIAGATNGTLVLPAVSSASVGNYAVAVTNAAGTVTSLAVSLTIAPAGSVPTDGLIGRYPLDGDGRDLSSSGNNLILNGVQPAPDRNGNANGAVYLNGTNAWMVTSSDVPISGAQPRTISVWIKSDALSFYKGNPVVIGQGDKSGVATLFDLTLGSTGGNLQSWSTASAATAWVHGSWGEANSSNFSIIANSWVHVAATTAGTLGSTKIYYDGVKQPQTFTAGGQTVSLAQPYATVRTKMRVSTGSISSGPINDAGIFWNQGFRGNLDDIRIYNRELTEAEVLALSRDVSTGTSVPEITTQPVGLLVGAGQTAQFRVIASGAAPLSYQWLKNGAPIAGATGPTLTFVSVNSADAGIYTVSVSNSGGTVISSGAALTFGTAPVIGSQPVAVSVAAGQPAQFSVSATGLAPLSYQWLKNGSPISGATGAALTFTSVTSTDAGTYAVMVGNGAGTVTSAGATLTVGTAPVIITQPASISVTLGSRAEWRVVANASGPLAYQWQRLRADGTWYNVGWYGEAVILEVANYGDPGSFRVIVSNQAGSVVSAAMTLTVTAPLGVSVVTSLTTPAVGGVLTLTAAASGTGPFTYQWSRNGSAIGGATGSVLSVLYVTPADAGSYTCTARSAQGAVTSAPVNVTVQASTGTIRLVNTSTRIEVGTGDGVLITGMVMEGAGKKSYLIRAVGPALAGFGVTGSLADPELTVYGANGVELAYNDNWPSALSGIMSGAGAFGLPTGSKDAAVVVALSRGPYTFKVSGVGNTTGVALLEIYELP